jgi:histidyl-tRNA synthetase
MPAPTHKFQPPKGTRDFYPSEMAARRHLEAMWRTVSVNHGFDEVEGPTFEHLELYTVKSGPGIVSELFSFRRAGGDADYALRPEFTPTLARMVAARGTQLPKPIKWYSIPTHYRAERPQRGRLREFLQWNVDLVGEASMSAEAELIALAVEFLEAAGLTPEQVRIRIGHREALEDALRAYGVPDEKLAEAFSAVDAAEKQPAAAFRATLAGLGIAEARLDEFVAFLGLGGGAGGSDAASRHPRELDLPQLEPLHEQLEGIGVAPWCEYRPGIARGLAYYTGTVFEIHDVTGAERAIAGGGRYDGLIEMFGGAPMPAAGFAMGDVVISLVLRKLGLLDEPEAYLPRPDVFVISSGDDAAEAERPRLVARLRRRGFHVRHSYRATRNVGKLLGEAAKTRARRAVILGREIADSVVMVKDLESGEQGPVPLDELEGHLRSPTPS